MMSLRAVQRQEGGPYRSYGNYHRAQQVHLYTWIHLHWTLLVLKLHATEILKLRGTQ